LTFFYPFEWAAADGPSSPIVREYGTIEPRFKGDYLKVVRPLLHPSADNLRPEAILHALSDPERAAIFAGIAGTDCVRRCSVLADTGERVIPKSSLSQHFKVLREAGLIRSERQGVEMRNYSRCDEINERFPGLLPSIMTAYGLASGKA
jgi:DNA-binding transcriptional ArsR family regulator